MYLTYEAYQSMGGTLDETAFNNFEYEAECIVNWYTFNRLKNEDPEKYPPELARCMNRLIELAKLEADALMLGKQTTTTVDAEGHKTTTTVSTYIKSQANDGVSVHYNSVDANELFNRLTASGRGNPIETTVFRYLNGVRNSLGKRLLYRGTYPDE